MPDIQRQFIAEVRKDLPNAMTTEQIDVHFDQIKVGTDGATYFLAYGLEQLTPPRYHPS